VWIWQIAKATLAFAVLPSRMIDSAAKAACFFHLGRARVSPRISIVSEVRAKQLPLFRSENSVCLTQVRHSVEMRTSCQLPDACTTFLG